jgi:hypothetical protein
MVPTVGSGPLTYGQERNPTVPAVKTQKDLRYHVTA